MKIKGKVKDLRDMLKRAGCGGLFDPVTFELNKDTIVVKMREDADIGMTLGNFEYLDVEDVEDNEEFIVDTSELRDQLKVVPGEDDFVAIPKDGYLEIKTESDELIKFHMQGDWKEKTLNSNEIPIKSEGDTMYYSDVELTGDVELNASELSKVVSRMDVVDVDFVKFNVEDGKLEVTVGDLTSDNYHPRKFKPNADVKDSEGNEEIEVSFGLRKVIDVISGDVRLHFSKESPLVIFDEDKQYKTGYILAPLEESEKSG